MASGGCGLGWVDVGSDDGVIVRIENGASEAAVVALAVTATPNVSTGSTGEAPAQRSLADTTIRVPGGGNATGRLPCGALLTITASVGDAAGSPVGLVGDGTGTLGFDSGTVGSNGERYLEVGTHLACTDTIVIQVLGRTDGKVTVVAQGETLPESISPPSGTEDSGAPAAGTGSGSRLTFRLENATATAADIMLTPGTTGTLTPGTTGEDESLAVVVGPVRVPPGQFTAVPMTTRTVTRQTTRACHDCGRLPGAASRYGTVNAGSVTVSPTPGNGNGTYAPSFH